MVGWNTFEFVLRNWFDLFTVDETLGGLFGKRQDQFDDEGTGGKTVSRWEGLQGRGCMK